ncbi:hypothetical protein ACFL6C_03110 [Myxococcota bacterium]
MEDLDVLKHSVNATLRKARQRAGRCGKEVDDEAPGSPRRESRAALAEVVEAQRHLCDRLRREIAGIAERRRGMDEAAERHANERFELEHEIEVVELQIDLTRRRRKKLEGQLGQEKDELARAREDRGARARSMVQTRDALERLSDKLKGMR